MLNRTNKKNESGRSMVEMLGVLAVIGVLSIGGIAGYTVAMRSHRANEIVNATSMAYMMGISANDGTGGQEMVYSPNPDGVTSITFKETNQIEIEGIADATLCAQVKSKFGDKATECPNASPYKLTVTFGDVKTATEVPQQDPCSECTAENCGCSGCIPQYPSGSCVSESMCNNICGGSCNDNALDRHEFCCSRSEGFKKGCP